MTARRRRQIAWSLRGLALAALVVHALGRQASHSGGLVEVARWADHPVPLIGAAVVLTVVSAVVELEFRTRWSQIGGAAVLVALMFVGFPIALLSYATGGDGRAVDRKADPHRPDRVLTVTDTAFSVDPVYHVELLTGTGWSARHWDLGVWDERDGRGSFKRAEWSGPDRITVTSATETTVFTVDPATGRPGDPTTARR
ncbi:hypothetical protein AB0D08_25785 [Kitasatospora sp. NPDC048540]|uniref:hypothetical protein n=1 Tax=unclassified Kitasatospora TaxID=2633591 RepID=UPI0011EA674D|nr:hypothetical protein [Kitasatospora sp. MBT63]